MNIKKRHHYCSHLKRREQSRAEQHDNHHLAHKTRNLPATPISSTNKQLQSSLLESQSL
ncbi:hypothetical protein JXA12_05890 [Candidatus Woesearchaeota archaeon]|nr:hypothetical protein [Candidatus Woesearchaeota archaeon]